MAGERKHWGQHLFGADRLCVSCGKALDRSERITLVEIPADAGDGMFYRWGLWHTRCAIAAEPLRIFTPQELRVGLLIGEGMTLAAIGAQVGLAHGTVVRKVRRMRDKTGCANRVKLALYIRRAREALHARRRERREQIAA